MLISRPPHHPYCCLITQTIDKYYLRIHITMPHKTTYTTFTGSLARTGYAAARRIPARPPTAAPADSSTSFPTALSGGPFLKKPARYISIPNFDKGLVIVAKRQPPRWAAENATPRPAAAATQERPLSLVTNPRKPAPPALAPPALAPPRQPALPAAAARAATPLLMSAPLANQGGALPVVEPPQADPVDLSKPLKKRKVAAEREEEAEVCQHTVNCTNRGCKPFSEMSFAQATTDVVRACQRETLSLPRRNGYQVPMHPNNWNWKRRKPDPILILLKDVFFEESHFRALYALRALIRGQCDHVVFHEFAGPERGEAPYARQVDAIYKIEMNVDWRALVDCPDYPMVKSPEDWNVAVTATERLSRLERLIKDLSVVMPVEGELPTLRYPAIESPFSNALWAKLPTPFSEGELVGFNKYGLHPLHTARTTQLHLLPPEFYPECRKI